MAVNPQSLGVGPISSSQRLNVGNVPFRETARATAALYLDPLFERVRERVVYGSDPEIGFNWQDVPVPERHSGYEWRYAVATNRQHFADITRAIDESIQRREVIARSPIGAQIAAEIFNPVNFIGIPLGGPLVSGGRVALTQTALRSGAAAGVVEAGLNFGVIQPFDPVQSYTESLVNTASVALFGTGFGALGAIPAARRMAALDGMRQQAQTLYNVTERANAAGVSLSDAAMAQPRDQRPFGALEDVEERNQEYLNRIAELERDLARVGAQSGEARLIQDRIDQLRTEQQPYAQEVFFRGLEEEGINTADIYRPSQGGDNWVLNWVTTPMRRTLTGDFGAANNTVKGNMTRLAFDGGTQLELHRAGVADGLSVYQAATRELGEFARANDEIMSLWAEDTAAPAIGSSVLAGRDVNATNLLRRAQRDPNTFEAWVTEVNRKRVLAEEMSPSEQRAAQIIDRYFESWERRLIETGQLRTRQVIGRQLDRLRQEVESLNAQLARADDPRARAKLIKNEELIAELEFELENPTLGKLEAYLPRYWNIGEVRRNRGRLAEILSNYYRENPYIFSFNESLKKWERVQLATDPDSIARRVDQTIDNILNERGDRGPEEVFLGTGRAGHIRARQLDIPNSLVWDFIEQNPLALMRNYTARTAPQYHFAKAFSGSRADVVERIRTAMREAGNSEKKIQAAVRDFNHMYDRVVGSVLRDPEAWNQRAAMVLRNVTSMTYLGASGIAALGDAGRIVMETELPTLARSMQGFLDPAVRAMSVRETRISSGALELLLGSGGLRIVDDQNFNFLQNGRMDRVMSAFHTLNLLGPVTVMLKQFAGANGAHMLIEYSQKLARGQANAFETTYLARHGIDADAARRIAAAPWQTDPNSGLILPNVDAWEGNYPVPEVDGNRVRIIEETEDGSPIGKTVKDPANPFVDRYVPAFFRPNEGGDGGTIYFDRDYIEGEMYDQRVWTSPRREGVTPLPEDAFPTPRAWANFVMWHEIMHTRFSAADLGFEPKSAAYENRINELAMEAHRNSENVSRETAELFRGALATHVNNVVMAATPADKPIIMDGVVYIRTEIAERFGLREDPNTPGYARVENGLLGLPLQFFAFTLANVNKTVGLMMQGAVRNRLMGVVAMMGMGYLITSIRTPDYVWDEMSPQDKLGRAFDMSGVAALYSDLFYTTLQTSLAMGGPNLTGGFLSPRYPQEPNAVDAVTGLTGAATGWTADMVRSAQTFASGDYGEGASQFIRNLPFSNLWFLRDDINQLGRYLAN